MSECTRQAAHAVSLRLRCARLQIKLQLEESAPLLVQLQAMASCSLGLQILSRPQLQRTCLPGSRASPQGKCEHARSHGIVMMQPAASGVQPQAPQMRAQLGAGANTLLVG